jgi:hypothetical protein
MEEAILILQVITQWVCIFFQVRQLYSLYKGKARSTDILISILAASVFVLELVLFGLGREISRLTIFVWPWISMTYFLSHKYSNKEN